MNFNGLLMLNNHLLLWSQLNASVSIMCCSVIVLKLVGTSITESALIVLYSSLFA